METNSVLETTKRPLIQLASLSDDEKGTEDEEEDTEGGDAGGGVPSKAPPNVNLMRGGECQLQSIFARRDGASESAQL